MHCGGLLHGPFVRVENLNAKVCIGSILEKTLEHLFAKVKFSVVA